VSAPEQTPEASPPAPPGRTPEGDGGGRPARAHPHVARFQLFSGALIVVSIFAVTAAIIFGTTSKHSSSSGGPTWAAFAPSTDGLDAGARQIADHVGRQYRFPTGEQLVAVTGGPLELCASAECLPMKIAVRESAADGGDINLLEGRGVLYRLCGLGAKCVIEKGKASPERHLLLRRQALELALYSFHDLDDVDHVVVFMPPPKKGTEPSQALHFRRGDVAGQLARPLKASLPTPAPTPDTMTQSPDAQFVQNLTFGNLFKFSLTQSNQDANVFLVLDPLPTES